MHSSAELRKRLLDEINAGDVSVINILGKLVTSLEKADFQLFQDKQSALESLSRLNLRGKQGNLLPKTLKSLVMLLVNNILDSSTTEMAVKVTVNLGLQNHVTLQLMEHIETRCKSERVLSALYGLKALGAGTPDVICRLLAIFPHLSPSGLVDIQSGLTEQACLSAAVDLLRSFGQGCFDDRVLTALEALAQNPRATSTRHYAPKQRTELITAALTLIRDKYAAILAQDQLQQEKMATERSEGRGPGEDQAMPSERSMLCGTVLSTAQDCLRDPEVDVRRSAARLIGVAAVGQVYAKVICHQLTTWLVSPDDFLQRCAIGNMIDLLFHTCPTTDMAVALLEDEDERIQKVWCTPLLIYE